jgi:2-methylaconitate cis-trans-isomerase PrpF
MLCLTQCMGLAMATRKLTKEENQQIIADERAKAKLGDPASHITVHVEDETDDSGQAVVHVLRTTRTVMPSDWKPKDA